LKFRRLLSRTRVLGTGSVQNDRPLRENRGKEREILHCVSFVGFVQNDRPLRENWEKREGDSSLRLLRRLRSE